MEASLLCFTHYRAYKLRRESYHGSKGYAFQSEHRFFLSVKIISRSKDLSDNLIKVMTPFRKMNKYIMIYIPLQGYYFLYVNATNC